MERKSTSEIVKFGQTNLTSEQIINRFVQQVNNGLPLKQEELVWQFLGAEKVKAKFVYKDFPDFSKPVIISPNHYLRTRLQRMDYLNFSTIDSMRDTALATFGSGHVDTRWIIKRVGEPSMDELPNHIPNWITDRVDVLGVINRFPEYRDRVLAKMRKVRDAQNILEPAFEYLMLEDNMGMPEARKFGRQVKSIMNDNGVLGAFIEDRPKNKLTSPASGYVHLLSMTEKCDYQVWPVSIFAEGSNFYNVTFGSVVQNQGQRPEIIAQLVMDEVGLNLPQWLSGQHQNWLD